MKGEKKNSAFAAGIGYTVGNVLIKGIGILTLPLFSRIMSTAEFGAYNVFVSYESLLFVIIGLALHSSIRSANSEFDGVLLFNPHEAVNSKEYKGKRVLIENLLRHCPESWVEKMRSMRSKMQTSYVLHDYSKVFEVVLKRAFKYKDKDTFNMAFLEWDNTARYKDKATVYHGCTPTVFKSYFTRLLKQESETHSEGKQFVYINAWNEWAEGTYLEPDTDNGYAYLEAVKQSVEEVNSQ